MSTFVEMNDLAGAVRARAVVDALIPSIERAIAKELIAAEAGALWAAVMLRTWIETRRTYGNLPDEGIALQMHQAIAAELEAALALCDSKPVGESWKPPHFENTEAAVELDQLIARLLLVVADAMGVEAASPEIIKRFARSHARESLRDLELRLQEILIFDCRTPRPEWSGRHSRGKREFHMLGQYWEVYRAILELHGSSEIGWTPHPMLRFIVNLKRRMRDCLTAIGQPDLDAAMNEALEIPFDMDTTTVWEEWGLPIVAKASEAFEGARLDSPTTGVELTAAENLFIQTAYAQLRDLESKTKTEFSRMLARVDKQFQRVERVAPAQPATCFEWVGKVEHGLRRLVVEHLRRVHGDGWIEALEARLGDDAAIAAKQTMKQRNVQDGDQLIHFTQLSDVVRVMAADYALFQEALGLRRREFNGLAAQILKGRTEEAHNRPEALWPAIEKQRVSVACHDLLNAIAGRRAGES